MNPIHSEKMRCWYERYLRRNRARQDTEWGRPQVHHALAEPVTVIYKSYEYR